MPSPPAGTATAGGPAATVAEAVVTVHTEAVVAMDKEALPDAQVIEAARVEAAAGMAAPTAAREAEEETWR